MKVTRRRFELTDADAYWTLIQDPEVAGPAGLSHSRQEDPKQLMYRLYQDPQEFALVRDDQVIGQLGIYQREADPTATSREVGFLLARPYWGQGIMTAQLKQVFDELKASGITSVWAGVFLDNTRSIHLLERLGFHYQTTVSLPAGLQAGQPQALGYYQKDLRNEN